jgi:hypothetical protein
MLNPIEDYAALDKSRIKVYFTSSYGTLQKRKTGGYKLPKATRKDSDLTEETQKDYIQVVVQKQFSSKLSMNVKDYNDLSRNPGQMGGTKKRDSFTSHNSFHIQKWADI